jgi:hypothetical protein
MTKAKISEYDAVASNNTDVNGVNIAENCPPSGMNNMGREIMAALKRFQTGSDGDGVTVGGNLVVSGSSTLATTAISSADINGGTIDGTAIGGASAAAGAFTTLSATGVTTVQAGTNSAPAITTTGDTNTGIFFPAADTIAFTEGGAEAMRIDASGNLGLGVTPSAWGNGRVALQLKSNGALYSGDNLAALSSNAYDDGSFKYISTNAASLYENRLGQHAWYNAPSGTAGNTISFTQAMTLDASGRLLIGATSGSRKLEVHTANGTETAILLNQSGVGAATLFVPASTNALAFGLFNGGSGIVEERARIDSSGNLLVGTTNTVIWNTTNTGVVIGGSTDPAIQISRSGDVNLLLNRTTSDGDIQVFARQGALVGSVSVTTLLTTYNTTSDYRLKNNQTPLTGSGAFIDALQPKTWNWAQDGSKGAGFIAHEFAEVSPSSVSGIKDAVDKEGNPVYQAMQASSAEVMANLVAEIQSLRKRLAAANL